LSQKFQAAVFARQTWMQDAAEEKIRVTLQGLLGEMAIVARFIQCSLPQTGNDADNAVVEDFSWLLKTERTAAKTCRFRGDDTRSWRASVPPSSKTKGNQLSLMSG
jgi:hypothetical protein